MAILVGGIAFPLAPPAAAGDLAASCDPVASSLLPYYRALIRHYCSAAFAAATSTPAAASQYPEACEAAAAAPADVCLARSAQRLPLLTLSPRRARDAGQETFGSVSDKVEYRLEYVLPAFDPEVEERVRPILLAVRHLLLAATYHGGDANVPGSALALAAAGLDEIEFGEADFSDFEGPQRRLPMLAMSLIVKVSTREDPNAGALLARQLATLDAGSDADGGLVTALAEVQT